MTDYTPTTDEAKRNYKAGAWLNGGRNPDQFNPAVYEPIYFAEFDRWLAGVEREAAEKAWDEGRQWLAEQGGDVTTNNDPNPYRAAAFGLMAGQEGENDEQRTQH